MPHAAFINDAAARLGVPRAVLALGAGVAVLAFFLFGLGASLVTLAVGVAFPAWTTFLALEGGDASPDALRSALAYWLCFAALELAGPFLRWLPMFTTAKIGLLVYLQVPATRGADYVFRSFLRPTLVRHRPAVEDMLSALFGAGASAVESARGATAGLASSTSAAAFAASAAALAQRAGAHGGAGAHAPGGSAGDAGVDPARIFGVMGEPKMD